MKKLIIFFLLMLAVPKGLLAQTYTVGPGGNYSTLYDAFYDINNANISGALTFQIIGNITETNTAELQPSGNGNGSYYTSVLIYPTSSGLKIDGDLDAPLINLNGATNVTIDGRVNGTGSTIDLILTNVNTGSSASTIQFIESAQNNTVKYCTIKGAETSATSGVIFFSTATTGTGNDGNTIDNNNITSDAAGRPINAIYSLGSSGYENSGITISNNNIYNFLKNGTSSNGILFSSFTTTCTISNNSFYETASFAPTASVTYNIIQINNTSGTGFTVTNNFIGGRLASCGGSPLTKTNAYNSTFIGISLNVGTGSASSIQNNTINNFDWSNSATAPWTGINILGGAVNVGTITGNTIGATTGTGSIAITGGGSGTNIIGINIGSTGTVDCENNTIGSVTAATGSSTDANNFTGINKTATAGTTTISNNTIGSTSTGSSINASSTSTAAAQSVIGINSAGSGTITISTNTIANLNNNSSSTSTTVRGKITGIASSGGTNTISNNVIHDLAIANANDATNQTASVSGLSLTGNTSVKTITGNTIYNLSNTYSSFTGSVVGIFFLGSTGANVVSGNFINSLSVSSSSSAAFIYGINISAGATTYSNNIISLGGATATTIYGIYETGTSGNNNNFYFNTIYIGGSTGSSSIKSYDIYSAVTTNSRDFRNNILSNARSGSSGSNEHYSLFIVSTGGTITCDYNDYFVSGTGGTIGNYGGNKLSLPIVTGQDAHSSSSDPQFAGTGTTATDYKPGASLQGITGTGITIDYSSSSRNLTPTMGAWEMSINKWIGTTSNDWNTTSNWTGGVIPGTDANIIFDSSPVNDCYLDADHSVTNITNAQSSHPLVTNGHKLTIKGSLVFSNGAKINASSTSSTIDFAGSSAQNIPASAFVSDQVYNLTIENSNNVTFNGTLIILNNFTTTTGQLNAFANSPTLVFGGSSAQTIGTGQLASNRVYNLTINNSAGVSLNSDLTVDNTLTVTAGILTLGSSKSLTLKGSLSLTGQIDPSASGTTLIFAGTSVQSIPSGAFSNSNKVYNLTINNPNNVTFSGTIDLLNTLTTTSGRLDASTNNPTFTLGGSSAQTLDAVQFVSNKAYNLTIDNSAGVTLNSDFTVDNDMTISSGSFTISAPRLLTVTGTLTNSVGNTGLVIKSGSNGNDGKLINNSSSVGGTVEMSYTGGNNGSAAIYHYFVPPVASMSFDNSSVYNAGVDLGLSSFNGDLVNYSEVAAGSNKDNGWQYFDGYNGTTAFNSLISSMGYNIHSQSNDKITFKGALNGGAASFGPLSFTNLGWNLVGNPYPCNYDLHGISLLTGSGDGVDNTVYFNNNGGYAIWNVELGLGTSGFSSIMPPMQGFFVHTTSTGKTLSLPTTSKTSSAAAPSRSKGYDLVKTVKLVLNNGEVPDETIVCVVDKATSGFDSDFDAYKFFGGGTATPFIYTEVNSIKYALNAIPDPGSSTVNIPVTVILKSAGTYKIDITEFENLDGYNVVLKHGSDVTILSKGSSYSFTSGAGTLTDFQLVINNVITGVENVAPEKLKTWYSNNYFYISCPTEMASGNANLVIYDIQGRPVLNNNPISLTPGQIIQLPLNLRTGVYITHILINNQTFVSKIVVF
jgi:hypothetical protein